MSVNIKPLVAEIRDDPDLAGYASMSDAKVAKHLNAKAATAARESIQVDDFVAVISPAWDAIKASGRDYCSMLATMREGVPTGRARVMAQLNKVFAGQTKVLASLSKRTTRSVSRAFIAGIEHHVKEGYVARARKIIAGG